MEDSKTVPEGSSSPSVGDRSWKADQALDELLTHLEEEAAEIIQACTKLRRFSPEGQDPRQENGRLNHQQLAFEFGQLLLVWHALCHREPSLFPTTEVQLGRTSKVEKLFRYLKHSRIDWVGLPGGPVTTCLK